MLKFFLGLAIVCFTTFCGRVFSKKYRRRKKFFVQMSEFNERFLSEISYYKRPLDEFFKGYLYSGDFQELLREVTKLRKDLGGAVTPVNLVDPSRFDFLTADERRMVGDYFLTLGKGDSTSQKVYFGGMKERLQAIRKKSEEESKKYGDLYIKLGVLCGLAILVLIV